MEKFGIIQLDDIKEEVNISGICITHCILFFMLQIKSIILDRTESIVTDDHIIAYAIDPRFRGSKLDSKQLGVVHTFFEVNQNSNQAYRLFKSKLGMFSLFLSVLIYPF